MTDKEYLAKKGVYNDDLREIFSEYVGKLVNDVPNPTSDDEKLCQDIAFEFLSMRLKKLDLTNPGYGKRDLNNMN